MKCGEEQPSCNQCVRTGRTCDGYQPSTKNSDSVVVRRSMNMIDPSRGHRLAPGLDTVISGNAREKRSFHFFAQSLRQDLSDALRLSALDRLILQLSYSNAAIKASVVALGSIGERRCINNVMTWENEQANQCHMLAIHEYGKAVTHLKEQLQEDSVHLELQTLVTCFLLAIFDFLQGDEVGSMVHLRSGLNILIRARDPELSLSSRMHQDMCKSIASDRMWYFDSIDSLFNV